jgi:parallel beta-helix repeat protein
MKYTSKPRCVRVFLRLMVALTTGLFVLTLCNAQNAEGFHWHKGRSWKVEPVSCGDEITTDTSLFSDLDCSDYSESAALTLQEGANLNMNGKKIIGNSGINCIEIKGDGVKIWRGTVTQCKYGIRVRSNHNRITSVEVSDSDDVGIRIDGNENKVTSVKVSGSSDTGIRIKGSENWITSAKVSSSDDRGVRIEGDDNLLIWCTVTFSHTQGIKIDGGNRNKVYANSVYDNCRDGIEIEGGNDNKLFYNQVNDNGNPQTCDYFGEQYKPWYYAGIDVLADSKNNEIKYNRAGCNSGCVGSNEYPCSARERDFWDENGDTGDNGAAINEWKNNSIVCKNAEPERSPNPDE